MLMNLYLCPSDGYKITKNFQFTIDMFNQETQTMLTEDEAREKYSNKQSLDSDIQNDIAKLIKQENEALLRQVEALVQERTGTKSKLSTTTTRITVKQLYNKFITEKQNNKRHTAPTTYRDYRSTYEDFIFILDCEEKDIGHLKRADFQKFSDALLKLPSRRVIKPQYKNLTFKEICKLKLTKKDLLAYNSRVRKLQNVKLFFDVATHKRNRLLEENIANDFLLPAAKDKREQDKPKYPLSQENLEKLFDSKIFNNRLDFNLSLEPEKVWIPLLAMLTGMRENEICQLQLTDIKSDTYTHNGITEEIHYLDLNADGNKKLKNDNAYRLIPIHKELIDMGFLKYVQSRKKGTLLFKNIRYNIKQEKHSFEYSKSFMSYFRRWITKDPTQVFHSFRHTVGDQLIRNTAMHKVPKDVMNRIMGHERPRDMTSSNYSGGFTPLELNEGMKTLSFEIESLNVLKEKMRTFYKV